MEIKKRRELLKEIICMKEKNIIKMERLKVKEIMKTENYKMQALNISSVMK